MEKEIRKIKREDVEREQDEVRRTELAMLKLLAKKYPSEVQKFASSVKSNFSLTKSFI